MGSLMLFQCNQWFTHSYLGYMAVYFRSYGGVRTSIMLVVSEAQYSGEVGLREEQLLTHDANTVINICI